MISRILMLVTALVLTSSCLKQGNVPKIPGVNGPTVNVVNGKILMGLGLENVTLPAGISIPLSNDLKGASLTVGPDVENGGSLVQVSFDPKSLESDHFQIVPSNTLPNGEPFPFTLDGELPAHAFNFPKVLDTTVYASKDVFGLYFPISLESPVTFGAYYPLKIGGKEVGHFTLVANNDQNIGSGIIVMLSIKQLKNNKDIRTAIKYSKRRKFKNRVF